ncbi:hypothetical protein GYMLUDRAFT_62384 [Collybiopsis luxurians FD-317 M1]|uniref:Uncharacterized protein n=1 Tax=Collybiopsis luxurians FD-317 M1 TaxID=944289 RepID=A0A0D0BLH6_9AGAR|nr:hypothetical protein GYMLUDRAFT_62384 [Collybiopsis luxurians FD-317 M1]
MSTFEPRGISAFFSPNKNTIFSKGAEDNFANYIEAVLSGSVGFIHLHGMMLAVEGWCKETGKGTCRTDGIILKCLFRTPKEVQFSDSPKMYSMVDLGSTLAVHHFSVAKSDEELGLAHRAMVKYEGSDSWDRIWKCNRDRASCMHISAAHQSM